MVRNSRPALACRIEPNFVRSRSVPLELEPQAAEPLNNFAIPKAREPAHSSTHNHRIVESFRSW